MPKFSKLNQGFGNALVVYFINQNNNLIFILFPLFIDGTWRLLEQMFSLLIVPNVPFPSGYFAKKDKFFSCVRKRKKTREIALMIQLEQQQHGEFWVGGVVGR